MEPNRRPAVAPHVEESAVVSTGNGLLGRLLSLVLIIAALLFVGAYISRIVGSATADHTVKTKEYQALFLTNGQVYFGKLTQVNSSYVKLTNIYYLQVQQTVQPSTSASAANNQQVSLAKLGGELHGPEDTMYVARDQVLFWENLKTSGKVTKAIQDYISSNPSAK